MTGTRAEWAIWTLAVLATVFFLRAASVLLIPIVIGLLLSYALEPVVAWLERHRVPRLAGASLVLLAILGLLGWGTYTLRANCDSLQRLQPGSLKTHGRQPAPLEHAEANNHNRRRGRFRQRPARAADPP
jgi:predicted PurR-regulated permease PerM